MAPSPSIPSWLLLGAALRALVGCGPAATNERVEARAPLTVVPPGAGTDLHPVPSTTPVAPEACRYETASYGFLQGSVTLRRDRGAPAFATLRQGGLSLEVKRRSPLSATGEVRSHGLVLEGTMHPEEVGFYPAEVLRFSEVSVPRSGTRITLAEARPNGELVARIDPAPDDQPLERAVACTDLTLERRNFDVEEQLVDWKLEQVVPAPGGLSLAATWDGPIRHVVPEWDDEFERLFVRERRGERALVVWPRELDVLVGWVANEQLDTRPPASVGGTRCASGFGILGVKASEQRRCSAPLVVSVAFEGARWRAGRIMAGTTVSVIDRTGADVVVGVHGAAITLTKGATLLASSAEVDACPLLP